MTLERYGFEEDNAGWYLHQYDLLDLGGFRKLLFNIYIVKQFLKRTMDINQTILCDFDYLTLLLILDGFRKLLFNIKDYFGIK